MIPLVKLIGSRNMFELFATTKEAAKARAEADKKSAEQTAESIRKSGEQAAKSLEER